MNRSKFWFGLVVVALLLVPAVHGSAGGDQPQKRKYDDERLGESKDISDKFSWARIRFGEVPSVGAELGDHGPMWSHDYPDGGLHYMKILSEVSKLQVTLDTNEYIFSFTDPEIFKYPMAYLCEVGYMHLTEEEAAGMREYCLRGGFLIIDDFRGPYHMQNLTENLKRAFPELEMKELSLSHPIFNCFYSIKTLDVRPPYGRGKPVFYGLEDKKGRLMMVINYNNDVSEYWQWSNDDAFAPIEDTNDAYKFGVNYAIYAVTH